MINKNKNLIRNIVSLLVTFIMLFSCIPLNKAYAEGYDVNQGGGGGSGGTVGNHEIIWNSEEFIRCSIWFAENGDWSNSTGVRPVGLASDLRSPSYASPQYGLPRIFTEARENQNTSRHYQVNNGRFIQGNTYYNMVMPNLVPGLTEEEYNANAGNASLEFPVIFTKNKNGVNSHEYFKHFSVRNELLASVQGNRFGSPEGSNGEWQSVQDMENGVYHLAGGSTLSGQYVILLKPGFFGKMSDGTPIGLTLRDVLALHDGGSNILSQVVDPVVDCANALFVNDTWEMLGLDGNNGGNSTTSITADIEHCRAKLGASVIEFNTGEGQIPVINYYYDLTVPGGLVGTGLEDIKTVWTPILSEDTPSFDKAATTSTKVKVTGNEYKAPLISSPKEGGRQYKLVMGFMSLKDDLDGNLDIKEDWRLQFYDALNLGQISKEESLEDLLEQSTEIQGLNNRTNIVTNYIDFIDRNIGNDTSISD